VGKVGRPRKVNKNSITNSYECAVGFPNANGTPFFGQQNPFAPQISQTNTLFENMRWYMVSNMRQPLSEAYVEIGLLQAVVDVPVDDALRGGIEIKSKQLEEDQIRELKIDMEQKDDLNIAAQAAKWNRLYGGAGILILLDDQDPELPLNINSINKNSSLEFRAGDMWEFFWDKQNTEGYDPSLQMEDFEYYNYYAEQVHKSRVLRMTGITAPSFIRPRLRGWGFSVAETLIRSINQYLKASDVAFEVLDEFKVDFYKIKNLVNTLMDPTASTKVASRLRTMNWQKNYQNAVVMDADDDHDSKQLSFAGLAETMQQIRMQVAADMRMPITKLFGTTASTGLGNTDQNDMENYNSMVESQVRNKLKFHILKMAELRCQELFGMIPDDLEIDFKPLRILTAEQEENVKTQKFNRILQARQSGEIDSKTFKEACNRDDLLSVQLDLTNDSLNPNDSVSEDENADEEPGADQPPDMSSPRADWEYGGEKAKKNSVEFDRASYASDGGDGWTTKRVVENPGNVDESLWSKAKETSQKAFGKLNWKFVTWKYKKMGGKF
jgi:phage-related protein (TIGR01555 family)